MVSGRRPLGRAVAFFALFAVVFGACSAAIASANPGASEEIWSPHQIVDALKTAYPDAISEVTRRDGDWALLVRGQWFYWAHGRLLPEDARDNWAKYDPIPFYRYPKELPPIVPLTPPERQGIEEQIRERETNPPRRNSAFYDAIWRAPNEAAAYDRVKTTYFLGRTVEIHRELLEDLAAVEEEILTAERFDPAVARFVQSLGHLEGYNWREISGTSSLSYHSYGAAIDLVPVSYRGKQAYWQWAETIFPEWYVLSYSDRYEVPQPVVKAFERHGFVWGGKWLFFDNMHFEYRPEILTLNGISWSPRS